MEDIQNVVNNLKEMNEEAQRKKNLSSFEIEKRLSEFEERKKVFATLKNEFNYSSQVNNY